MAPKDGVSKMWVCVRPLYYLTIAITLSGCVQLAAPYSEDIDKKASSLQEDFFKFVANMQSQAGKPEGYYVKQSTNYDNFDVQLAVIRLRSDAWGGVACGKALGATSKAAQSAFRDSQVANSLKGMMTSPGFGDVTCVTALSILAQQQMQDLRSLHQLACQPSAPPRRCQSIFSTGPLFNIISSDQGQAPAVTLTSITINEIVRQEAMRKPPPK